MKPQALNLRSKSRPARCHAVSSRGITGPDRNRFLVSGGRRTEPRSPVIDHTQLKTSMAGETRNVMPRKGSGGPEAYS